MAHPEFTLLGDAVWLDFVNSARGRTLSPPDLLPDAAAFTRWAHAQRLIQLDGGAPYPAIREFRQQLTALAEALDAGPAAARRERSPPSTRCWPGAPAATGSPGSAASGGSSSRRPGPLAPLEAIARSAATTLADPGVIVRRCAGETCSLFFADSSPNRSRRWCAAALCGANQRVERRRGPRR